MKTSCLCNKQYAQIQTAVKEPPHPQQKSWGWGQDYAEKETKTCFTSIKFWTQFRFT